jgi:hypothetical protein
MDLTEINWQEAVARLARERTQAVTCAQVVKRYGGAGAIDRLSLTYGEAKAEYDGVIGGLLVALARKKEPESLPDLQERLKRGFEKREEFCNAAASLLPPPAPGERGVLGDIVKGAIEPIIQAVKEIYFRAKDDNALTRRTIETQLEATSWPDFASVKPAA